MKDRIKVALAQMNVKPGMIDENLSNALSMIEDAKRKGANVVVFPEMMFGYLVGDKFTSDEYCRNLMLANEALRDASEGIVLIYGNIYYDNNINKRVGEGWHPNKDGRIRKYNAAYIFQNTQPVKKTLETTFIPEGIQPKTHLPNYRIFDDERYFFSIKDIARDFGVNVNELIQPFEIQVGARKIKIGLENCEDLWCEDYRMDLKAFNPTKILVENGAEFVFNISASPWTFGKNKARDRRVEFVALDTGKEKMVPFFYVNCCGAQNNGKNIVTFDGGTTVYNKEGKPIIFASEAYKQELLIIEESDLERKVKTRDEPPKIEQKYNAIIQGMRHTKDMVGAKELGNIAIGLSGGIDSSLSAVLAVKAFGREKVIGVNMPTQYNTQKTKDAAESLARNLGIEYLIVPINGIVEQTSALLKKTLGLSDIAPKDLGNIMARIRGADVLAGISALKKALISNNGNKVEVALGYCTLYGDMVGAYAPLADLTKTEIIEMSRYVNKIEGRELIPVNLFPDRLWRFSDDKIIPSAELEKNQTDPMKFGYHCALIEAMTDYKINGAGDFMKMYLDGTLHLLIEKHMDGLVEDSKGLGLELMRRYNLHNPKEFLDDLLWLTKNIESSLAVAKRIQAPPIIMTSKTSYGFDRRESIIPFEVTPEQSHLAEKIKKMKEYIPK